MEKNIIWIASFPKSGNTWVRLLLNALVHRKTALVELHVDAGINGACTTKTLLKDYLPEKATLKERLKTRGDALRKLSQSREPGKKLVLKTHSALLDFEKKPQIPMDVTAGAILVIRNPFDVLCFCMNHFGLNQEESFNFLDKTNATIGETDKDLPVLLTNWDGYNRSWTKNATFPILPLRYEDLKSHPFTSAQRMCKFFKLKRTENEIINAIRATSFENMQKLEDDKGFAEASEYSERFFYKGEVGYFKDKLSQATIDKVMARFGESMKQVGYDYVDDHLTIKPLTIKQKVPAAASNLINPNLIKSPPKIELNTLMEYYQKGRYDLAQNLAKTLTQQYPNHPFGWKVLGALFKQAGKLQDALIANLRELEISPDDAEAHSNLGITLKELGRLEEAEASYNKAIAIKPELAEAHSNLGNTLQELGRPEEAEASYKKAIAIKPELAEAHNNLGNTLQKLGRLDEAEASYNKAIAIKPDYVEAHSNLGSTLKELGRLEEAKASYNKAIVIKSDYEVAHYNSGNTLQKLGRLEEAEASYNKAIAIRPDYAEAHNNLGSTLHEQGRLQEAETSYNKAIAIKPDSAEAHSNLGNTLQNSADWTRQRQVITKRLRSSLSWQKRIATWATH